MYYIFAILTGYLTGSIPFAYLLLKKTKGIDITIEGSGNVGAMNTYEVSSSKTLGLIVLIFDAFKGFFSVFITTVLFGNEFIYPALALFFAVLSHCFNPWLKFKGGRGLASAAGGAVLIFPYLLAVWGIIWFIAYIIRKDIHFANISATILSLLLILNTINIAFKYVYPTPDSESALLFFSVSVLTIILIKHFEPMLEVFRLKKITRNNDAEKI